MSVSDPQLRIAQLGSELKWAHLKIQVLEERLRQQRIRMLVRIPGQGERDSGVNVKNVPG